MPYEDDEIRRAARERLQARMERRGSAHTLASNSPKQSRTSRIPRPEGLPRPTGGRSSDRPAGRGTGSPLGSLETARSANSFDLGPVSIPLPDFVPPVAVPIAAALVVALLVFGLLVPSCTRGSGTDTPQDAQTAVADTSSGAAGSSDASDSPAAGTVQQVAQAKADAEEAVQNAGQVASVDKQESHQAALAALLGEETSAKLLAAAKTSPEALWIAAHPAAYAFDGVEVQYKVLKLAADEPAAVAYVRAFPESYPAESASDDRDLAMDDGSPSSNVPDTGTPHLYQWDRRWGYLTYSSAAFGLTGCGPTSYAMVYQGITGKNDKDPADMAKLAEERGYMSEYEGTAGEFFVDTAEELGLYCEEMYPDVESLQNALSHGHLVIANLAPGYFTSTGHFLVLTGLDADGKAVINDPYSVERSSQTWDLDLIVSESYTMYSYSRAI